MGLFSSFSRLVATMFGMAEGGTQRATDKLLTSSPDAIRNQFRKTREDWVRDYNVSSTHFMKTIFYDFFRNFSA